MFWLEDVKPLATRTLEGRRFKDGGSLACNLAHRLPTALDEPNRLELELPGVGLLLLGHTPLLRESIVHVSRLHQTGISSVLFREQGSKTGTLLHIFLPVLLLLIIATMRGNERTACFQPIPSLSARSVAISLQESAPFFSSPYTLQEKGETQTQS